jgi:hypothetical protein
MKKLFIAGIFSMMTCFITANVAPPEAFISEIYIDENDNWSVEMGFFYQEFSDFDSVWIETTTGSSRILSLTITECPGDWFSFPYIAVITNFNLVFPLSINRDCDYVKLISYADGYINTDFVSFGNYPGSYLDSIGIGESISYAEFYALGVSGTASFCIDQSPTIGECHDTTGCMGTYSGKVFTPDGPPFTGGYICFPVHNLQAQIQEDGSFTSPAFARRYFFDEVYQYPPGMHYPVDYFTFFLKPDSAYYHDIYTHYYVDIKDEQYDDENSVVIFPNPVNTSTKFYIDKDKFKNAGNLKLVIVDNSGEKRFEHQLKGDESKVLWQPGGNFPAGMYFYYLLEDSNIIKSGKLIKI